MLNIKKIYIFLSTLVISISAQAATANWTGKVYFVLTITNQQGVNCEYVFSSKRFWKTFVGASCPISIEVE